jgi:hypothetical protein
MTIAIIISTLAVAIGIIPFYLIVFILLIRLLYNWCLKSKKGALNKYYSKSKDESQDLLIPSE